MELGNNEQNPVAKDKKPMLGRLRLFKDRLMPKETPPFLWEEWKQTIIDNRQNGIPEESAPLCFSISKSLLDTFQEMLPIRRPGRVENRKPSEAADKAKKGLEVARSLIVDASGKRLMVNKQDVGESKLTATGARIELDKAVRSEIGVLHTHPKDVMPTSTDLLFFFNHNNMVGLVITPYRVVAFFRTNKTPVLNPIIAKGYLEGMGKAKGRSIDESGVWILNHSDLNELHVLSYEAERGKNVFVRKDNVK